MCKESVTGPGPTEGVLQWPFRHSEPPISTMPLEGVLRLLFSSALGRASKQMFLIIASLHHKPEVPTEAGGKGDREEQGGHGPHKPSLGRPSER